MDKSGLGPRRGTDMRYGVSTGAQNRLYPPTRFLRASYALSGTDTALQPGEKHSKTLRTDPSWY
eukprot:1001599-Rhodomonas_salina.4